MKLKIKERLLLLQLLPAVGNYVTLKIVRDLQNDLSISEAEMKEKEVTYGEDQVLWNDKKDPGKDVDIGAEATKIIRQSLIETNEKEELKPDHIELYELFCGDS